MLIKLILFFFNSLNKKIEGISKDQLTFNEFAQVFDFSRDPFPRMTVEELAQLFTMFDPTNKGEITAQDFIKIYQETPEGRSGMTDMDTILKDFELLDPVRKAISPEEFLKILNIQNQPGFMNQNQYRGYQQQNVSNYGYAGSQYDKNYTGSPERINPNQGYANSPERNSPYQQGQGMGVSQGLNQQQNLGKSQYSTGANVPR